MNSLKQSKHSPYLFGCTKMLKASVANVKKGLGAIVRRALNERQYWIDWVRIEPGGPDFAKVTICAPPTFMRGTAYKQS